MYEVERARMGSFRDLWVGLYRKESKKRK
jgi:hypothetical protein